ncbi:AraC family transcriptional regulator [Tunicatimonas pelagia]|uniref:AraC family transcriptional regulator n=1 Tax=Tunicatimonas pelagia TaxID=931531 RepID=UPI002665E278|nr:AraC family transcriptional regulator [Tunicatimonas pelagia]WKN42086.1 AraC family transcriptional regulator [Tunicatimonas pelagia]
MKSALQKSPIPEKYAFVAKTLTDPIFDPVWHFHSEYQLFLVLKGSGTRFIGDTVKPFTAGDLTFTGPNLPHLWRSDQEGKAGENLKHSEGIVVYFNEDLVGEHLFQKEEAIKLRQLFQNSLRGIEITGETAKSIRAMLMALLRLEGFAGVLELLKILDCLSKSSEIVLLASPGYTNTLKEDDTERMNEVYAYVMKHFKEKVTITTLAELTNMTPTSFSRYFKTHANKTFSDFISEIRVGHACKLLIEQEMNVSQIGYESGFQTLSNFNRQFKQITKRTPLRYKKEYHTNYRSRKLK